MGIPDHLTCLLRNLYAGQEATVRTGHGTTDWFQIGKGVCQGCILSPCLLNLYAEYIMRNAGLDEAQCGIKIAWKIPWTKEPGRLQSMGSLRVGHDRETSLSLFTFMHWRKKWQPTRYSCLENPRDGGAWWAAIYGVAQSRTRLKRQQQQQQQQHT